MDNRDNYTKRHVMSGAALIASILFFTCPNLWADGATGGYEMSFVESRAHGNVMVQGRYRLAIYLLSGKVHDPIAAHTNLCVAHTMIGEYTEARRHCNRAVEASEQAATSAPESQHDQSVQNWVVALSNRGVLRAIRNQEGAQDDFRQAMELQVYSDTAARNLARLNQNESRELAAQ